MVFSHAGIEGEKKRLDFYQEKAGEKHFKGGNEKDRAVLGIGLKSSI